MNLLNLCLYRLNNSSHCSIYKVFSMKTDFSLADKSLVENGDEQALLYENTMWSGLIFYMD